MSAHVAIRKFKDVQRLRIQCCWILRSFLLLHFFSREGRAGGFDVLAMRQDHRIPSRIVDSDARILRGASPLTPTLRVRGVVKSFTPRPLVLPLYRSLRYHSANSLPLKHALWWPLRFTKRGDEQELRSAQNSPPPLSERGSTHPLSPGLFLSRTPLYFFIMHAHQTCIPFGRERKRGFLSPLFSSAVIPADPLSRDPVLFRKTPVQRLWTPALRDSGFRRSERFRNRQTQGGRGVSSCLQRVSGISEGAGNVLSPCLVEERAVYYHEQIFP